MTLAVSAHQSVPNQSEIERLDARKRSYTVPSVLVFVLYWLFYLPGLVVNILFYREARRTERIAGTRLPGTGFLLVMLWLNVIAFGLIALLALASMAAGVSPFIYDLF